jgi:hypothetical protein
MTAGNNSKLMGQPSISLYGELRDDELDTVRGGIIAVLIGMLTPSIPIPPPGPEFGYR